MSADGDSGKDGRPDPRQLSASGLDESQLSAEDLQALHAAVVLRSAPLGMAAKLHTLAQDDLQAGRPEPIPRGAAPAAGAIRALKLRIAPLPDKVRLKRLNTALPTPRYRRDERVARALPVVRKRLIIGELSSEQEHALARGLREQFGVDLSGWRVAAVFAHVPPEAKGAIVVDPELRWAAFSLPRGLPPQKCQAGYYLVVLTETDVEDSAGKTRKLLLRL